MSVLKTYGEGFSGFAPSATYGFDGESIHGKIDGASAVRQAVELALSTERWRYPIYSGDYGIELEELFGAAVRPSAADIRRRIEETLLEDDRISSIENFSVGFSGDRADITFTAVTDFGELNVERSVSLG